MGTRVDMKGGTRTRPTRKCWMNDVTGTESTVLLSFHLGLEGIRQFEDILDSGVLKPCMKRFEGTFIEVGEGRVRHVNVKAFTIDHSILLVVVDLSGATGFRGTRVSRKIKTDALFPNGAIRIGDPN